MTEGGFNVLMFLFVGRFRQRLDNIRQLVSKKPTEEYGKLCWGCSWKWVPKFTTK